MRTANSSIVTAPIAMIYATNEDLFLRALDGLTNAEMWNRPIKKNNPMLWLAGHVAQTRAQVLQILGEPYDTKWGELFVRGTQLKDPVQYPAIVEIKHTMSDISARLQKKLESINDEQLTHAAQGLQVPNAKTLADQVAFFALHDSYHIGQLAYIRKMLGYPALVG
jgi:uncharacterized damage-inducible protein DinB